MNKKLLLVIILLCSYFFGFGQTTIFNIPGGGAYPNVGWSDSNNITSEPIDKSSYYMVQPGSPGDLITTSSYDLSAHTSATLTIDIGSFGSGGHNSLLVEVSFDGGTNFTQSYTTTVTLSSTETLRTINITSVSNDMVLRFSVNNTSGRGIRMQNIHLEGIGFVSIGPTITYDGNGNIGGAVPVDASSPYISGDTVTVLGNTGSLTNTCNTFNGWNTAANGSGTSYVSSNTFNISANTTLYAQWLSTDKTVTFDANGGTGTMSNQMACSSTSLTNNTFTYTGFTFNSWNTASDGSGTSYVDGAAYDFSADISLYAQWDVYVGPCASESFSNSDATTSYSDSSYIGDNGVTWTYTESRDEDTYGITGNGLMLRDTNSALTSSSVSGGIGDFTCSLRKAFTGSGNRQVELFVNGVSQGTSIAWDNTTIQTFTVSGINISGNVIIEIRNITGKQVIIDDISWTCYTPCTDTLDYYNLELPASGSITVGSLFNVNAQVYEPGITNDGDSPDDAGDGIEVWIGVNTSDTDPSTWTESSWAIAPFHSQIGNNDQFRLDIGSSLPSGTYYYASRFSLNGCIYTYAYYGTNSGVLTVDQVDWCNLQFPEVGNIVSGGIFDVYARVFEPGVTDASSTAAGAGIECWIGYSEVDATVGNSINNSATRTDFESSDWIWVPAGYNQDYGNDDEFFVDIGSCITPGNYVYASRFRLNNGAYSYGGIIPPNGGDFWDGSTYISGDLTVSDPPIANVVITEIMYNSSGTDDEWIEVCNVSGSTQDISNYVIDVTGEGTVFTFPCNTTIADGVCITIDIGDGGGADYNVDCPFGADYSNSLGSGTLGNDADTITLYTSNGSTPADEVTYNSSDGGTVSSLHIVDITQDNSDTGTNWTEVDYGGSSGVNSLLPNCVPMVAEINVEGNLGFYPDILDGDTTPIGTDNTLFAAQYIGASQSKSYRIRNLGGVDLNISNITITGDTADFMVTISPSSPIVYNDLSLLEITFSPTTIGTRTAVVHIFNNDDNTDGDSEDEYTFTIQGDGLCVAGSNSITPSSGPVGTIVTVTGSDLNTATASFNGMSATVNHISDTLMEVIVPNGSVTGNLEIYDDLPCTSILPFTVIDNQIGSCEGGSTLGELFISEITDSTYGSLTYVEIYNATGTTVDLSNYTVSIYANGNTNPSSAASQSLNGMLAPNAIYVLTMGVQPPLNSSLCSVVGGDGSLGISSSTLFGINKKDNEHDFIGLYNSTVLIDSFGVLGDDDWMDSLHTTVSGDRGFNFRRLNTATPLPQNTFDDNDWNIIDWVGKGLGSCSTNDYSDIGIYDFSTGTPPTVDSGSTIVSSCNSATISVAGTEGYSGGNSLTYQWYYSAPGETDWTEVLDDAIYDDVTTATLDILDTSSLEGYQYYCQIREDDASCYVASNAIQLTLPTTTWNGSSWDNGAPDIDTIAIIDGNYNTLINDNIEACNLIVNETDGLGFPITLTISDGFFAMVQNNATINGNIIVSTSGSFVQVDDAGTFSLGPNGTAKVEKITAEMNNWYEYTYWSSPVEDETIEDALSEAATNRRFWFNAQNYRDSKKEQGNSNSYTDGQDDVDDDVSDGTGVDWQSASGVMQPGVGYASTHSSIGFNSIPCSGGPGCQFKYTFEGAFNTGTVTVPIYRNDDETGDNNWNLVGNPYPSAIFANDFLTTNAGVIGLVPLSPPVGGLSDGAIFLWSQASPPDEDNPGNQNQNFKQSDYAIINMSMQVAGGDGVTPSRFIPSGQSFFIAYANNPAPGAEISSSPLIYEGNIIFNNSMRRINTSANSQFFKTSEENDNKLWLNLTSDNGVFSQLGVVYIDGATKKYNGSAYDTERNLSIQRSSTIYSIINGEKNREFAIQAKSPSNLSLNEVIKLGFKTRINVPTLYKFSIPRFEGDFLKANSIYLKDRLLNTLHNLKDSDYVFTSETGEFNNRFEIVFRKKGKPSSKEEKYEHTLSSLKIIEHQSGTVEFNLNSAFDLKHITILDLQGKIIYNLNANGKSKLFNLNNLRQTIYIAKVELSDGSIITEKLVKRK